MVAVTTAIVSRNNIPVENITFTRSSYPSLTLLIQFVILLSETGCTKAAASLYISIIKTTCKTGTAQKFPRGNGKYLVSFMGFAPYDNPQVLIYVVVNEPNVADQPHSVFAQNIAREILEEVLPYMNIYPDEKKTGVNKGYDVTGSKDSSQYTGKHNGTKSRNEKKKKN